MDVTITSINESYTMQQENSRTQQAQAAQKVNQSQQIKLNQEELTASTATTSVVPKMDRVEISAEARQALEQSKQGEQMKLLNQAESSSVAKMTTAISEEDDSSSTDLTTLTEQQINQLVTKGQITKAEAQAELARRATSEVPAKEQTETNDIQQNEYEKNVENEKEAERYQSARYQYAEQNTRNIQSQYAGSRNVVA